MGKGIVCVVGIGIIIIVMAAFVFAPDVFDPITDLFGEQTINAKLSVEHYNNGEKVEVPGPTFSFQLGERTVDEIRVSIEWEVTGTDVDMDTLSLTVSIKLYLVNQWSGDESEIGKHSSQSDNPDWFMTKGWMLDNILPFTDENIVNGWTIHVYGSVHATATDIYNNQLSKSWSDDYYVGYGWKDDMGTLSLKAGWV